MGGFETGSIQDPRNHGNHRVRGFLLNGRAGEDRASFLRFIRMGRS